MSGVVCHPWPEPAELESEMDTTARVNAPIQSPMRLT